MTTRTVGVGRVGCRRADDDAGRRAASGVAGERRVAGDAETDDSDRQARQPHHRHVVEGSAVYYAQISGGGYEEGKKLAATKADYITYEMEHGPLDFKELREFMRGLLESGPTRTGHKTPAVVVTLPIAGTTDALRANAWMVQQALAAGVHGILLCNAESPEAARL